MPEPIVFKQTAHADTKAFEYVMSDASVDRYGDVVEAGGWDLRNFTRHPIALFNHDIDQPIGLWKDVRVDRGELRGRLVLAEGASPDIDKLAKLIDLGVLKAVSVGFKPLEREPIKEGKGVRYRRQELLECSLVTVPANPNALQVARSLKLSDAMIQRVFGVDAATALDGDPRGSTGVDAATSRGTGGAAMEPIAKKIESAQAKLDELKALLDAHEADIGDEPDEAALNKREELNKRLGLARRNLDSLEEIERNAGNRAVQTATEKKLLHGEIIPPAPIARPLFATPAAKQLEPKDRAMQVLVGLVIGQKLKRNPLEVIAERYGVDGKVDPVTRGMVDIVLRREGLDAMEVIQRAATAPATTTTSGWASQLVQTTNMGFLDLLMPMSVFPGLRARAGLSLDFGRAGVISIPNRASTPTVAGSFVAEGAPIPVRQAAFGSQTFTPKKMAVITSFTREIAEHSNPTIEGLLRNSIQEDTSVSLDTVLLDATVASAIRPAGIRAGVSVTTATAGGGFAALIGDIKALLGALITGSSGNLRRPVWIMNPIQAIALGLTQNAGGDFPFKQEVASGQFQGWPLVLSSTVTAGMVIVVDAADFVVIEGAAPRFDLSDQTVLVYDDTAPAQIGATGAPNVVGAPARSMFQTDSIALRMIFDVNWGLVRTGTVAWTQAVTW